MRSILLSYNLCMSRSSQLAVHKQDWEDLAELDPLWAVMSRKDKHVGKWEPGEFFESGKQEIDQLMTKVSSLLSSRERSLDFGCGVGRLTAALSAYFDESHGVDISEGMIERAKQFTPQCKFQVNATSDLKLFPDNYFDLVYSNIVLQHQPNKELIRQYIAEFIRVLKPNGVAAFMVPRRKSVRNLLNMKRTAFHMLRSLGASSDFLYRHGLHTMRMTALPVLEVEVVVARHGASFLSAAPSNAAHFGIFYMARKI